MPASDRHTPPSLRRELLTSGDPYLRNMGQTLDDRQLEALIDAFARAEQASSADRANICEGCGRDLSKTGFHAPACPIDEAEIKQALEEGGEEGLAKPGPDTTRG